MPDIEKWNGQIISSVVCINAISLPPPGKGEAVTIVLAKLVGTDLAKTTSAERRGIVYYGATAQSWYPIADSDDKHFIAWAKEKYPSATVVQADAVTCPPPPLNQLATRALAA